MKSHSSDTSGGPFETDDRFTFSTKRINWGSRTGPATTSSYTNLVVHDITNDGWLDIIAARSSGGFDFYSFNGTTWTQGSGIVFSGVISSIFLDDLDRDGWQDMVASSSQGVHVWKGLPGGNWTADFGPVSSGRAFLGVTAGDLNKDGYIDIAATEDLGATTGAIQIWYLDSDGTWFQRSRASTPTADPNNIGTGFMSVVKVSDVVTISEAWTLVCESALPDGGLFKVQGKRDLVFNRNMQSSGNSFTSDNGEVRDSLCSMVWSTIC